MPAVYVSTKTHKRLKVRAVQNGDKINTLAEQAILEFLRKENSK